MARGLSLPGLAEMMLQPSFLPSFLPSFPGCRQVAQHACSSRSQAFVISHLSLPCRGASWGLGSGTGAGSFWGHYVGYLQSFGFCPCFCSQLPRGLARASVWSVAVVHASGCGCRSRVGGCCVCWSHQSFAHLLFSGHWSRASGPLRGYLCRGSSPPYAYAMQPVPVRLCPVHGACPLVVFLFPESSRSPPTPRSLPCPSRLVGSRSASQTAHSTGVDPWRKFEVVLWSQNMEQITTPARPWGGGGGGGGLVPRS